MQIRRLTLALAFAAAAAPAGTAEYSPELDGAIEACITAINQQNGGQILGWEVDWAHGGLAFNFEAVSPDNQVRTLRCEAGTVTASERKTGNKKYEMLSSRVKVPEGAARHTAGGEYPGAELRRMKYELNWRGRPVYSYEWGLKDGRTAWIEVNGETGQIDKTLSERK
jgi:uncharacterized membrane protein YkoI